MADRRAEPLSFASETDLVLHFSMELLVPTVSQSLIL